MITLAWQARDGTTIGHARIALSGTPMENNLDEVQTIIEFANYGYGMRHEVRRKVVSFNGKEKINFSIFKIF